MGQMGWRANLCREAREVAHDGPNLLLDDQTLPVAVKELKGLADLLALGRESLLLVVVKRHAVAVRRHLAHTLCSPAQKASRSPTSLCC